MYTAYAQAAQGAPIEQPNQLLGFAPIIIIFAIFYFLVIRPTRQQQLNQEKEHKSMLENLKKNDEIITASGIHGTVMNVKDTSITLKIDDNVKIEIEKNAVATLKKKRD